jgi:hypothetical protein
MIFISMAFTCAGDERFLADNYSLICAFPVAEAQPTGQIDYQFDSPKPEYKLAKGNFTVVSPEMSGTLDIIFLENRNSNYSLTDWELSDLLLDAFDELEFNLTDRGFTYDTVKADATSKLIKILDPSGRYMGGAYGYWTEQGIVNLFIFEGYGPQDKTEGQLKRMMIVRNGKTNASDIVISYPPFLLPPLI